MTPQGYPLVAITDIGTEKESAYLVVGWEVDEFKVIRPKVVPVGVETQATSAFWLTSESIVWQVLGTK